MPRVEEVFALLQEDPDGSEHLVIIPAIGGPMPMVGPNREAMEAAGKLLLGAPQPVHLVRFGTREVLQTFAPGPMPAMRSAPAKGVQ